MNKIDSQIEADDMADLLAENAALKAELAREEVIQVDKIKDARFFRVTCIIGFLIGLGIYATGGDERAAILFGFERPYPVGITCAILYGVGAVIFHQRLRRLEKASV